LDMPRLNLDKRSRTASDHSCPAGWQTAAGGPGEIGLVCAGEVEIAREAFRRARRAKRAEAELRQTQRRRRPALIAEAGMVLLRETRPALVLRNARGLGGPPASSCSAPATCKTARPPGCRRRGRQG
jgi:hypothetical protein